MRVVPIQIASSTSISSLRKIRADLSTFKTALENITCRVSSVIERKKDLMAHVDQLFVNVEVKEGNMDSNSVKPVPYDCSRYSCIFVETYV